MDLRQLDALIAVADRRTFSAAASALHTVQSNISARIAKLERELDVVLVDRAQNRLTVAGDMVVHRSRRIQAELMAIVDDLGSLRAEIVGAANLGMIGTTARWVSATLVTTMSEMHPRVELTLVESTTAGLLPQLSSGRLDMALVNSPIDDNDFEVTPLYEEELILLCPPDHRLARESQIYIGQLDGEPVLVGPPHNAIRDVIDAAAGEQGIEITPLAMIDGIRLTASLVMDGLGPAVLPATALGLARRSEVVRVPIVDAPRRQVGLARRARSLPAAPARAVSEILMGFFSPDASLPDGVHSLTDHVTPTPSP